MQVVSNNLYGNGIINENFFTWGILYFKWVKERENECEPDLAKPKTKGSQKKDVIVRRIIRYNDSIGERFIWQKHYNSERGSKCENIWLWFRKLHF